MTFPIVCEGVFQFSKKGINIQIATESNGRQHIFQNQEALVNLSLKTAIHNTNRIINKTPIDKNPFLFANINSL